MDDASDEALMAAVGTGDGHAFERLAARHGPWATRFAARVAGSAAEAPDIVQEAMLRVWVKAPNWRIEASEASSSDGAPRLARFKTWFTRILLNLAIDQRRRPAHADLAAAPEPMSETPGPFERAAAGEIGRRVDAAMAALPDRQREAIALCQFAGLGNVEAAAALGIGVGALESLLVRARRSLRADLADLMENPR